MLEKGWHIELPVVGGQCGKSGFILARGENPVSFCEDEKISVFQKEHRSLDLVEDTVATGQTCAPSDNSDDSNVLDDGCNPEEGCSRDRCNTDNYTEGETDEPVQEAASFMSCASMNINSNGQLDSGDVVGHLTRDKSLMTEKDPGLQRVKHISIGDLPLKPLGLSLSGSGMRLYVGVASTGESGVPQDKDAKNNSKSKKLKATAQVKKSKRSTAAPAAVQSTDASTSTANLLVVKETEVQREKRLDTARPSNSSQTTLQDKVHCRATMSSPVTEPHRRIGYEVPPTRQDSRPMRHSYQRPVQRRAIEMHRSPAARGVDCRQDNSSSSATDEINASPHFSHRTRESQDYFDGEPVSEINGRRSFVCRSPREELSERRTSIKTWSSPRDEHRRTRCIDDMVDDRLDSQLNESHNATRKRKESTDSHSSYTQQRMTRRDHQDFQRRPIGDHERMEMCEGQIEYDRDDYYRNHKGESSRKEHHHKRFKASTERDSYREDNHCNNSRTYKDHSRSSQRKQTFEERPTARVMLNHESDREESGSGCDDSDEDVLIVSPHKHDKANYNARDKTAPGRGVIDKVKTEPNSPEKEKGGKVSNFANQPQTSVGTLNEDTLAEIIESTNSLQRDMRQAYKEVRHLSRCFSGVAKERNNNSTNEEPSSESDAHPRAGLKDQVCAIM